MLGERLQEIRKDHGDTQQALADKLHVSLHAVRCWEQNKSDPSHDTLVSICRLYHVSSDYLLGLIDDDPSLILHRRRRLSIENQTLLRRFESFLLHDQEGNTGR
ncbi:MAG: helix-turn-helix transcriptional regulator [Clostridia bacterium]|nr:helix-turn-helix transcriptional regulator [Clostridia bacterium]